LGEKIMRNVLKLGSLLVLLAAYGCASPTGITGSIDTQGTSVAAINAGAALPSGKVLPDSRIAAAVPAGFVSFCLRFPDQCMLSKDQPAIVTLSSAQWLELQEVNQAVNLAIKPMDDQRHYGRAEYWNIPTDGFGDCEDYALTKRRDLMAAGFPAQALRIAVVLTWRGEAHAILTVATDHGDYVLDNLSNSIQNWDRTDYQWIERQDPSKAWGWVSLDPSRNSTLVAAAAAGPVSAVN
jgi:predicted transglutaminase-like cysteine proteinase